MSIFPPLTPLFSCCSYEQFCDYLESLKQGVRREVLGFHGRNVCLYYSGREAKSLRGELEGKRASLVVGFSTQGYRDLEAAYQSLLEEWCVPPEVIVFGGDRSDDGGVGCLVKLLKDRIDVRVIAVIKSTLTHCLEDHVDRYVRYDDEDWWGGIDEEGNVRGASAVYLDDDLKELEGEYGVVAVGGGKIARDEVTIAREKGIGVVFIKAQNRDAELGEVDKLFKNNVS